MDALNFYCPGCRCVHPDSWMLGGECMAANGWRGWLFQHDLNDTTQEVLDEAWTAYTIQALEDGRDRRAEESGWRTDYHTAARSYSRSEMATEDKAARSRGYY